MSIISVKNLSKTFKKPIREEGLRGMIKSFFSREYEEVHAVDDISFDIAEGEIVGYIGANGAGKSTTIKMMCGILHPTGGSVTVDGMDFEGHRQDINREMGVVFGQKTQLWWDIPLIETFKILKSIYEVSDEDYEERFNYLCDLLDMRPFLTQTVRSLSLGQRMRADFAAALIHSPKIVYLDCSAYLVLYKHVKTNCRLIKVNNFRRVNKRRRKIRPHSLSERKGAHSLGKEGAHIKKVTKIVKSFLVIFVRNLVNALENLECFNKRNIPP